MKLRKLTRRIIFLGVILLFLAAVPFAIQYNLQYDKYGTIDRPTESVFIQICTVDAGSYNNTLKQKAAEYANKNKGVRLFVLPLSAEQLNGHDYDIRIIREGAVLHAFISGNQTEYEIEHCNKFLEKVRLEVEGIQINIKT